MLINRAICMVRWLVILVVVVYGIVFFVCFSGAIDAFPPLMLPSRATPGTMGRGWRERATLPFGVRVPLTRKAETYEDLDTVVYKKQSGVSIDKIADVTILIKTMDRPHCVRTLVKDIQSQLPNISILVADDGEYPAWKEDEGHPFMKYFRMPYDSGLSAGRNLMTSQVQTRYMLLLDDDFLWDPAVFDQFVRVMEEHPYLDLVGGRAGLHFAGFLHIFNSTLFLLQGKHGILEDTTNLVANSDTPGMPCEVVDFVPNFFFARTDTIMSLQWHNSLKIGEHEEFFLRFNYANYKVAFCPSIVVLNQQAKCSEVEPSGAEAEKKRRFNRGRARNFIKQGLKIHNLTRMAYCLGEGFVGPTWNRINDIPSASCYEVPLPEDCPPGKTGEQCDLCLPNHIGPDCKPCECSPHGTCVVRPGSTPTIIDCVCEAGWVGEKCNEQVQYTEDLIQDPTFVSLTTPDMDKWFPFKDGCFSFAQKGIWLVNDGHMSCGAGYKLVLAQEEIGVIKIAGWSMSTAVQQIENPASYSIYIDFTYNDNTMHYGQYIPFSTGTHGLEYKELYFKPKKPVAVMIVYVLLQNVHGSVYFQNVTVQTQLPAEDIFILNKRV